MPHRLIVNVIEESRLGGPQNRILMLAGPLAGAGWDTLVVAPEPDCKGLKAAAGRLAVKLEVLRIHRPRRDLRGFLAYVLTFVPELIHYWRLFARLRPALVHNNGATQIKVALAAWAAGVPLVWHLNDTRPERLFFGLFRLLSARTSTGFIVSSEATRRAYLDEGETVPVVISRPPVDLDRFSGLPLRSHVAGAPIVIAHVGNINPDKDIACLIRVAQLCHAKWGNNVVFRLAGQRPATQAAYLRSIDELIAKKPCCVEFIGFIDDIASLFRDTDMVICTSRAESGPMSVFEALAAGKAVVSTDVGDLADLNARHPGSMRIAPVGGHDELFRHIADIIGNRLFAQMGIAGRALAESELSMEAAAMAHCSIYEAAVNAKTCEVPLDL